MKQLKGQDVRPGPSGLSPSHVATDTPQSHPHEVQSCHPGAPQVFFLSIYSIPSLVSSLSYLHVGQIRFLSLLYC